MNKYTIDLDSNIFDALFKLNKSFYKELVIVSNNKVIGTVTDGDIRRYLIKNKSFSLNLKDYIHTNFKFIINHDKNEILKIFVNYDINLIPQVDEDLNLVSIVDRQKFFDELSGFESLNYDGNAKLGCRPWGYFKVIAETSLFKSKLIVLFPHQSISLQYHNHRKEFWYILEGSAEVRLNKDTFIKNSGEYVSIDFKSIHRIKNLDNSNNLLFIEIQQGDKFSEEDIKRIEDEYGRI